MPEVNMKDTFSTYHPLLNMLYFVGVIGVTVFVVHPVILAISLFGGNCIFRFAERMEKNS